MKKLLFLMCAGLILASCSKDEDNDDPKDLLPTEINVSNDWVEGTIAVGEEIWYRVKVEDAHIKASVEWAEASGHGESRDYDGDIVVSAFWSDGQTPYFENKDEGYNDKIKNFDLANGEKEFLVKVVGDSVGTFALRVKGEGIVNLEYTQVSIENKWIETSIGKDEIVGFNVDCTGADTVAIVWKDKDYDVSFTADIYGSVYQKDGETAYSDWVKGKPFVDKNKSEPEDPKGIILLNGETKIKVHISSKGGEKGNYAIKFVKWSELN